MILFLLVVFTFGWISNSVYSTYFSETDGTVTYTTVGYVDSDLIDEGPSDNKLATLVSDLLEKDPEDVSSPHDWIKEHQIKVYGDRIIIMLDNPEWAAFTDTNSMDPVLDSTSNAIEIIPQSEDDIHVGDIVSYKSKYADGTIIHRVIEKGSDKEGTYFILKGDNNPNPDPGKIRFDQIQRILVAIIY